MDGSGETLRSKARLVNTAATKTPKDLPLWNYDGSSTGQADCDDSEVTLVPAALYRDPFRQRDNMIVLCETLRKGKAASGSNRQWCKEVMDR